MSFSGTGQALVESCSLFSRREDFRVVEINEIDNRLPGAVGITHLFIDLGCREFKQFRTS